MEQENSPERDPSFAPRTGDQTKTSKARKHKRAPAGQAAPPEGLRPVRQNMLAKHAGKTRKQTKDDIPGKAI